MGPFQRETDNVGHTSEHKQFSVECLEMGPEYMAAFPIAKHFLNDLNREGKTLL